MAVLDDMKTKRDSPILENSKNFKERSESPALVRMSSDVTNACGNVHSVQPERDDMKEPSITNSDPVKVTLSQKGGDQRVIPLSTVTINKNIKIKSAIPKHRQQLLKWNGWGYKDSQFQLNEKTGTIQFTGNRYPIGNKDLPFFVQWARLNLNVNLEEPPSKLNTALPLPNPDDYPVPLLNNEFVSELDRKKISYSTDGIDRLYRSHGHSLQDIIFLRKLDFNKQRLPDLVVWPETHEDVVYLVNEANKRNLVIIPFGGGTSVSWAVSCPKHEKRMCISLDTSQMNRMLWLDRENLVACFEAGIIGQDLERCLQSHGYTSGHEPDSYEFSSLGGWVATRASGMKKNTYGNIEDLIISIKMVTPNGVLFRKCQVPRLSCGPDFNHVILGSEGTLGVITEVAFKIRPLPKMKKYGSLVFPDFESGFKAIREVARQRAQPSSIRLMDNEQFKFGQSLKGEPGYFESFMDGIKKTYITKIKKFDIHKMCVATLLFEGDEKDVSAHEKKIYKIASQFGGLPAGSKNGERGYTLTFVIAYIRDIALDYDIIAESFETSVPWDRALALCRNVKHRLIRECEKRGIVYYLVTHRITQSYDAGCCIYFYFGFNCSQVPNPLECYQELEDMARDEIIDSGGSLSHHHGVGKLRAKWYPKQVSEIGVTLYQMTKNELDPKNIFANGNFFSQDCHM